MKHLFTLLLLVILTVTKAQTYQTGHISFAANDAERNNRNVTAEVYYPANTAGDNVPLADGQFPIIVFGHGFLMQYSVYNNLWEPLTQNGYVCAFLTTEGGIAPNHSNFGLDFVFIKNTIQADAANNANSPFYQKIAATSAYMGHSMGGGSGVLAAQTDGNVTTYIGLAPAVTNPSSVDAAAEVSVPALIFSGSADAVTPAQTSHTPIYEGLTSNCKVFVSITGGSHCYFANTGSVCELGEGGGSFTVSRTQQQTITNNLLLPWVNYWLKNDAQALSTLNQQLATETGITFLSNCAQITNVNTSTIVKPTVYPNPITNNLYIDKGSNTPIKIEYKIVNVLGQHQISGKLAKNEDYINTTALVPGVYSLVLNYNNTTSQYRIIKQ
jgi:Secretion system C-terminal sorting domain